VDLCNTSDLNIFFHVFPMHHYDETSSLFCTVSIVLRSLLICVAWYLDVYIVAYLLQL